MIPLLLGRYIYIYYMIYLNQKYCRFHDLNAAVLILRFLVFLHINKIYRKRSTCKIEKKIVVQL